MKKISVVTTFHEQGLKDYGQRMITSFEQNWPNEIDLYVYAEDCNPSVSKDNVIVRDLHKSSKELVNFKEKWANIPKANGIPPDNIKRKRRDWNKGFKWDAVRFSHKVYSIFHCAKNTDADFLMWMDADMYCHSPITNEFINQMCPKSFDICYVGRAKKWPECGLYAINLHTLHGKEFLKEFQRMYDDAEKGIFLLEEWHDSFVFDAVLKRVKTNSLDWAAGLVQGEGHPLINSPWGAYLDHLKGGRKTLGKSKKTDLIKPRSEDYWR